jgi:hypothetical protein
MRDQTHTTDADQPLLASEAKAARMLGIGIRKMWELGNRGEHGDPTGIPRVRIGKRVLYDVADLRAFIDRQKGNRR